MYESIILQVFCKDTKAFDKPYQVFVANPRTGKLAILSYCSHCLRLEVFVALPFERFLFRASFSLLFAYFRKRFRACSHYEKGTSLT